MKYSNFEDSDDLNEYDYFSVYIYIIYKQTNKMSFTYMFKFIIIGDTGFFLNKYRSRKVLLTASIY